MEKICVAVRVRPSSKPDSVSTKGHKWRVGPHNVTLYSTLGTPINGQTYAFDHVFGAETKNVDIYNGLSKDVIMSALSGFNGTVFAYGQTSSGKTYTMKGTPSDPGIIRLAVHEVFSNIHETTSREFLIRVSYMEIYNEEINDLFAPENRRLQIHENLEKGIFVAGLREEIVDSPEQVFSLLEFGESHRHFGETNMNLYSSRSHTIFRMVIESRDTTQDGFEVDVNADAVRVSALNLVDLAGSERIAKTGAGGVRLKEGTHINKSLMTLGTVINKLSDGTGKQVGHIPYRDSKLTRILQPALGGNAKTAMICTVTPDEIHIDETRGTLQFASRAKRVTNCAQVNEILTDAALLKRQTREIEDLRMKLQGLPQSEHLEKEILNLRNELLKYELEKERLFIELQEEKKAQVDRERRIKEQEQKIENLSTLFMSSTTDDRDNDRHHKKLNRRETWCPRQLSSDLVTQDHSWMSVGKPVENEAMDNFLYSMRRDRNTTLPPAFDSSVYDDEDWNSSSAIEEPVPSSDFENIADEDTWMSLNKGHTTSSTVFTPNFFEKNRFSAQSTEGGKLENDMKDLQEKYEELQCSYDVKLQESTKDLQTKVDCTKNQLEKALNANLTLKAQVEQLLTENVKLKDELGFHLESQSRLKLVIEDVECEMDAVRLLTSSLQGILSDSLHVQAAMVKNIEDWSDPSPSKGRVGILSKRTKEKRASVERTKESSVQKCREIFDVDNAVQDRLAHLKVVSEMCTESREASVESKLKEMQRISRVVETRYTQTQAVFGNLGSEADGGTTSEGRQSAYCGGCLLSLFSTVRKHGSEHPRLYKEEQLTCQCDLIAEAHSRVMSLLSRCRSCDVHLPDLESTISNDGERNGTSAEVSGASLQGQAETGDEEPQPIWKEVISSSHIGCSFGILGRNGHKCVNLERALVGTNQIPVAMSDLCGHILRLLKPAFHVEDGITPSDDGKDNLRAHLDVQLKARLGSAMLLSTWLFEELQYILKHGLHCLKSYVKERGSLGLLLEGLQVILLENASLAVGLIQATCHDETLIDDLVSRLHGLNEFYNKVPVFKSGVPEADANAEKHQESRGVVSLERNRCKLDIQGKETSFVRPTPGSSLDQEATVHVEVSQQDIVLCDKMSDSTADEQASLMENLRMSREHIATLERQLAVSSVEKERIMKALIEEINGKEESVTTTKAELVKTLTDVIGEMAIHEQVLSGICVGIQDFEEELEQNGSNHGESFVEVGVYVQ